jgi:hypothetical protein
VSTGERAEDWVEALRNASITAGDNLWVSGDGRAEIDYGGGQIRLAGDTNVHVARLDDRILALFVAHGRIIVRVRVLDAGDTARIDTPNTQVSLTRPGLYRIDVSEDRERTTLVVREGEALASLAGGEQQVLPGQSAELVGHEPDYAEVRNGFYVDGFDSWSANRDRRYERSRSASYVSRQMIGYADLDDYGRWETYSEYGAVWFPTTVASGWAPYRYGHWSWVTGYGWTWVDDAPWGYAPFHYGRWAYVGHRWGWIPGGYVARPVWAPALVGWYGGSGWSFSVSYGAPVYGWVPLGWGEPYVPWWRNCSHRCWTMYNRPYAVNLAERPSAPPTRYTNWSSPGGVTAVAGATFTGRRPVHTNLVAVRPQAVASAPVLAHSPTLAKPTAATIPGAKPTIAAPPPAERFYRTRPMQAQPSSPGLVPGGGAVPTWGGGASRPTGPTSAPPAVARPATPSAPSSAPGMSRPQAAKPSVAAPPATPRVQPAQPARGQPAQPAYRQGTWGAPTPPVPRVAPASRPEARTAVPPSTSPTGIPMPRSAPPAAYVPPAPQPRGTAQPAAPVVRSAPPAQVAPAPATHSAPGPSVRSAPPPTRSAPPSDKPVPQRNGDKPTVQR